MAKYILAASTGGHLEELTRYAHDMDIADDSLWITFRTPQSESLLRGRRVHYVDYIRSRDFLSVVKTVPEVRRAIAGERFDGCISTGAALALAVFPVAKARRIPNRYIESIARSFGPSVSGRIVQYMRLAETHTPHSEWAGGRWKLQRSIFGDYRAVPRTQQAPHTGRPVKVFVTLGTIEGYAFRSLVKKVASLCADGVSVQWQLGATVEPNLPGRSVGLMSQEEFNAIARDADVVVSHAGVGTILNLLGLGIFPIVVPRRAARGEHVDDHQEQIAGFVESSGLALCREVEELNWADMRRAAGYRVVRADTPFHDNTKQSHPDNDSSMGDY